ncbi:MAG: hypothetical protein ACETWG_08975 [Candidatus Neomarinimicrobiota bacterium]
MASRRSFHSVGEAPRHGLYPLESGGVAEVTAISSITTGRYSLEQLVYDCRLMNAASNEGPEAALSLQRWYIDRQSEK